MKTTNSGKQLAVGNATEEYVVHLLKTRHYWVYPTAKKVGGQPVDLICGKDTQIWLIDVKHVRSEDCSFTLSRIEPNEWTTMQYAAEWANIEKSHMGFSIQFDRTMTVYWLGYEKALEMAENDEKSINLNRLIPIEEVLK